MHLFFSFLQAQSRLEENTGIVSPTTKQETAQIQKSCTEELNSKHLKYKQT